VSNLPLQRLLAEHGVLNLSALGLGKPKWMMMQAWKSAMLAA